MTTAEEELSVATLRDAAYAGSSHGPQRSRQAAICRLLRQEREEVCMAKDALETLAARLKEAGYQSGFKYLLRLHVSNGHMSTPQRMRTGKDWLDTRDLAEPRGVGWFMREIEISNVRIRI